jgi:ankyrin repeat protein
MKFGKSKKDITPHLLIATIAAMLLYVAASWWAGSGESQSPEPQTTKAPDISIHMAAEDGNIEVVKQHIAAGTDVNAKEEDGTPLHYAAWNGHKEVVELLIAAGADVNAKDDDGETPLDWAIDDKQTATADLLRKHGGKTGAELKAEGK